jgi:hypothetical protein
MKLTWSERNPLYDKYSVDISNRRQDTRVGIVTG